MKVLSILCLGLLCGGAMQASQETPVTKGSWFQGDQGPTGPMGPTGPRGIKGNRGEKGDPGPAFVTAYGVAMRDAVSDQLVPIEEHVSFTTPESTSLNNIGWIDAEKKFQIHLPGVYEVTYFVHCSSDWDNDEATALNVSLVYGSSDPSTQSFVSTFHPAITLPATADCETHGSAIVRLQVGDFVSLELNKTNPSYSHPIYWYTSGKVASLSLKRIGE